MWEEECEVTGIKVNSYSLFLTSSSFLNCRLQIYIYIYVPDSLITNIETSVQVTFGIKRTYILGEFHGFLYEVNKYCCGFWKISAVSNEQIHSIYREC